MQERRTYPDAERQTIIDGVHTLFSNVSSETVFIPWEDDTNPYGRVHDLKAALKLEIHVRTHFPDDARHLFGITQEKAMYHLKSFPAEKDPLTAATIYAIFVAAQCAFTGDTSDLFDAQQLEERFPMSPYEQKLKHVLDKDYFIDSIRGQYQFITSNMEDTIIHTASLLGHDIAANEIITRAANQPHAIFIREMACIEDAISKGKSETYSDLWTRSHQFRESTGYESFDSCINILLEAQIEEAIKNDSLEQLIEWIYKKGYGIRAMNWALMALETAQLYDSPLIPDIIHECETILQTLEIWEAPEQDPAIRKNFLDNHPHIAPMLQYIWTVETLITQLASIDPNHPVIDTCIWGSDTVRGLIDLLKTGEGSALADDILHAIARARQYTLAQETYERLKDTLGDVMQKKLDSILMEHVLSKQTPSLEDEVIKYSEQYIDRPQAFQNTWYELLETKVKDTFHACDIDVAINTMERIDRMTRLQLEAQAETQQQEEHIPIGRDYIGEPHMIFEAYTPKLIAVVAHRLLTLGDIQGFVNTIRDPRFAPEYYEKILISVEEALFPSTISPYVL